MTADGDSYAMGRTGLERERLTYQDRVYAPHTEHLLRLAGVSPGMRVLDVGCGPGTTSALLARVVGPRGEVVGVDEDPDTLAVAAEVTAAAGLGNVRFRRSAIDELPVESTFDAVFGRLILMHLPEPAATVSRLRGFVRPGGIVTFQEPNLSRARAVPEIDTWSAMMRWTIAAMRHAGSEPDMGDRLAATFTAAGLATPEVVGTSVGGDADSPAAAFVHRAVQTMRPMTIASGAATAEQIDELTLDRVVGQARTQRAVLYIPELVAAWTRTRLLVQGS